MSAAERSKKGIHIKLGELTVADPKETCGIRTGNRPQCGFLFSPACFSRISSAEVRISVRVRRISLHPYQNA